MIEVIKITEQHVLINEIEYIVIDEWILSSNPNDFALNGFYSSTGNGDGRISLSKDYEKFKEFFDIEEDRLLNGENNEIKNFEDKEFIILKEDLEKYLSKAKYKFRNPLNKDIYYGIVSEKNYNDTRIELNNDFESLKENLKDFNEIYKFKMTCLLDPYNELWLRHENAHDDKYKLIRRMTIPNYSYFYILKLKNNGEIIYYMKLCFNDDKIIPERLEDNLKDFEIDSKTIMQLCASLNAGQNIILTGVPGTGKTHLATIFANEVMGDEGHVLTTATSDWTTFDTIGGLIPNEEGNLEFREGKFLQAIKENKWLIIDEINRADIDKAFGQLFTVLSGQDVELPYYIKDINDTDKLIPIKIKSYDDYKSYYNEDTATYFIGKDWRIIATMNSYDKNALFDLSYAFMRRFMIIEVEVPKDLKFLNKLKNEDGDILYEKFSEKFKESFESLYKINTEYSDIDRKLGPAIFLEILKYIYYRMYFEEDNLDEFGKYNYNNDIFSEALIAFIIPQFEGLHSNQRKLVENFLKKEVFAEKDSKLVITKLDNMKSY